MNLTPWTRRERLAHAKPPAAGAGSKGKSAKPLGAQDRVNRYLANGGTLTAAQKRRIVKKAQANREDWESQGYSVTFADGCWRGYDVIGRCVSFGHAGEDHDSATHNEHGTKPAAVAS